MVLIIRFNWFTSTKDYSYSLYVCVQNRWAIICLKNNYLSACDALHRYHVALGFLLHLLPALHLFVYLVGLPSSHQPPGLQRTVCDGGLVHSGAFGVFVLVPEYGGAELPHPEQSVGQVYFNTTHSSNHITAALLYDHNTTAPNTHMKQTLTSWCLITGNFSLTSNFSLAKSDEALGRTYKKRFSKHVFLVTFYTSAEIMA